MDPYMQQKLDAEQEQRAQIAKMRSEKEKRAKDFAEYAQTQMNYIEEFFESKDVGNVIRIDGQRIPYPPPLQSLTQQIAMQFRREAKQVNLTFGISVSGDWIDCSISHGFTGVDRSPFQVRTMSQMTCTQVHRDTLETIWKNVIDLL